MLTVRAAARRAGCDPETVRRWIWQGKLRGHKLGGQYFITAADLEVMLGGQTKRSAKATAEPGLEEQAPKRDKAAEASALGEPVAVYMTEELKALSPAEIRAVLGEHHQDWSWVAKSDAVAERIRCTAGYIDVAEAVRASREEDRQ